MEQHRPTVHDIERSFLERRGEDIVLTDLDTLVEQMPESRQIKVCCNDSSARTDLLCHPRGNGAGACPEVKAAPSR